MASPHYHIRNATPEDCDRLYELIQEMGEYEKIADQIKTNASVLRKDGFGEKPSFRCLVAEVKGGVHSTIVGYAIYFYTYSTFQGKSMFLEDLFVTPSHRGKGIGSHLWKKVCQIGVEENCCRMDFHVLNWNAGAIALYKNQGAADLTLEEKWHLFRLGKQQMRKIADN